MMAFAHTLSSFATLGDEACCLAHSAGRPTQASVEGVTIALVPAVAAPVRGIGAFDSALVVVPCLRVALRARHIECV
jgi:hypothetical protein